MDNLWLKVEKGKSSRFEQFLFVTMFSKSCLLQRRQKAMIWGKGLRQHINKAANYLVIQNENISFLHYEFPRYCSYSQFRGKNHCYRSCMFNLFIKLLLKVLWRNTSSYKAMVHSWAFKGRYGPLVSKLSAADFILCGVVSLNKESAIIFFQWLTELIVTIPFHLQPMG